ncbi:kynB [Trichonephila inaurata madagascariensis]|uniref:KynB n=1 Tax=Trichonephila inaurata madagascariensis TaxID=2747483 RepID=A0A8X6M6T5_9ARAC|nr:kynB [Trichonephila inaurata madagascariensis]
MALLLLLLCSVASAAPLAKRMVDMTYTFDETTLNYPGMKKFELSTVQNGMTDEDSGCAAVVDITAKANDDPDAEATVQDLQQWESTTGQSLNETILLLRSGWGKRWGDREAFFGTAGDDPNQLHYPGLAPDAARWLVENRNVFGIGVDTLSFDNGPSLTKDVHQILLGHGLFGIENMANMEQLPIYGATLYVMPMKIGDASGALPES